MTDIKTFIARLADGTDLSREEARGAFSILMSGEATPAQIAGLLMALRVKGETVDEVTGAVETMRLKMTPVSAPGDAIDIVGTGGDAKGTYNISTCAAFIAAGAGLKVAKHGNRALSSKSGAADVLMALGIKIDLTPEQISRCIDDAGIGFMFAPAHHSSMKHVGPARVELGTRTIFNLLGPLSNPAGVKRQVVGVFSERWVEPLAHVLHQLGTDSAWICHGEGGYDELTPAGPSKVAQLKDGKITVVELSPKDFDARAGGHDQLLGGDAAYNAKALTDVLSGKSSAYAEAALMTASAALVVAGQAEDTRRGMELSRKAISSKNALQALHDLVEASNRS
jgi:anthranilate phosphoribosyltransferase